MSIGYHDTRLVFDERRDLLWKTLWEHHFSKYIPPCAAVLDMGCGYCEFTNNATAETLYALDSWEGFKTYLRKDAIGIVAPVTDLSAIPDDGIDVAFASNLFEHLSKDEIGATLEQLRMKLRPGGRLMLLQPNYRYCANEYFDDYTHVSIWSHLSIADFIASFGYGIVDVRPRFLPLTIKSRLPVSPMLIRAYLALPFSPLGKQMLITARRPD